ncbi:hypothetical protein SAMN04488168_12336 [Bacillus sp. 491mf]|uniref:hypothetical protein n=1 Tax=Bacillus sp. 491mf TaxID=1761755 RepID=UPI0008F02909|nr:hypothetical protein [Bacillus sp. 491mf]SFD18396.1 hypothetical protein SAMN04488168_12336 [Bacillus sp. 491mf]
MNDYMLEEAVKRVLGKVLLGDESRKGKGFYIPMFIDSKTQMWGMYVTDLRFFLPSALFGILLFFLNTPWWAQLFIDFTSFVLTLALVKIRPLRRDIPAYQHIGWFFNYRKRQKRFYYRKKVK